MNNLPAGSAVMQPQTPAKNDKGEVQVSGIEKALLQNNLADLTPEQRLKLYHTVCESLGLNPYTKPFEYITFDGKLILYAKKDCTEQLRNIHNISIELGEPKLADGLLIVRARATKGERHDESIGAVDIGSLKGKDRANALMKAETKAKRRVTLSICGLGILDESEVEDMAGARVLTVESQHSEQPAKGAEVQKAISAPREPAAELSLIDRVKWFQAEFSRRWGITEQQFKVWKGGELEEFTEADCAQLRELYVKAKQGRGDIKKAFGPIEDLTQQEEAAQ